jgi:hypothetical protein
VVTHSSLMSVSPEQELELIEVETPPNSPSAMLDFSSPMTAQEQSRSRVISPLKRQRARTDVRSSKRGRRTEILSSRTCRGKTPEGGGGNVSTTDMEAVQPDIDGGVSGTDVEDSDGAGLSSYELYVIAATEGRAGLEVIRRGLFVVQGWDAKNGCTTVSWIPMITGLRA